VVYRVAGLYIREVFDRLAAAYGDRKFLPEYEKYNERTRLALQLASFVIYQSQWAKRQLDTLYCRPEGSWRVISNGVDLTLFRPGSDWPRSPGKPPVLGAVGALRYRTRLEVLFDVARRLPEKPHLLLIGTMDEHCQRALDGLLRTPGWPDRVQHIPAVSPDKLVEHYRRMDCLVHTVVGDWCPNVVVEALACGVPVVCPTEGGTMELVGPGGIVVADPEWTYGEALRAGMAEAVVRVLEDLPAYQQRARFQAEANNDLEDVTTLYLEALGLPAQVSAESWRLNVIRLVEGLLPGCSVRCP
jgi:glycosyltransferase involved in cell wall biosynthesis